jgi:solute carrier family 9 (sodium/hydrogen exchanger), member 8
MFSFLGTFIAIVTSTIMFYSLRYISVFKEKDTHFSFRESMAFSSLISATDPVSVLSIFKEIGADLNLYSLIFGESIFNDAIGIVMY